MSRSRRKVPALKNNGHSKKENRQIVNRIVRRKFNDPDYEISNGSSYKKLFDSEFIYSVYRVETEGEAIEYYNDPLNDWIREKYDTLDKWLNHWKLVMLGK